MYKVDLISINFCDSEILMFCSRLFAFLLIICGKYLNRLAAKLSKNERTGRNENVIFCNFIQLFVFS